MKQQMLASVVLAGMLALPGVFCGGGENPVETQEYAMIGLWQEVLPPFLYIEDTLIINLELDADSTYDISVQEKANDTLFVHSGNWTTNDTAVVLNGTFCAVFDTTAEPDTLQPQADSICSIPAVVKKPTSNIWKVKLSELGAAFEAFPALSNPSLPLKPESILLEFVKQE